MVRTLKTEEWFHPDGFPVAVERRDPQEPFGWHNHEFSELVVVTSGRGRHVVERESWTVTAGDVFVIGGTRPHAYHDLEDLCLINVLFRPAKLALPERDLGALPGYVALFTLEPAWRRRPRFRSRLRLTSADFDRTLAMIDALEEELLGRQPGFGFMAMTHFMQVVGFLSRCYERTTDQDSTSLLRVAEAISHLELHHEQSVSLDELAAIAGMSRRAFQRTFRQAMGTSPISHLIQLRVSRAAEILRHEDATVSEIAFRVGFQDSNYFSRQFRRVIGCSPRDYRRQHRN